MPEPADDRWSAYRNHVDQVAVVVLPVEYPDEREPDEAWVVLSHGAAWDQDWLLRQVHSLASVDAGGQSAVDAPHLLESKETHFSWGADAAGVEILLFLAQWAVTSAAWDATKALARSMQHRISGNGSVQSERPLDDAEAEARAKWVATTHWKVPEDQLRVVSVELMPPADAFVVMVGPNGWRYECDLTAAGNNVTTSRLKRSRHS